MACPSLYCCEGAPSPHNPWPCDRISPCARNRTGLLCSHCQPGMTELLGSPTCIPNEECTNSKVRLALSLPTHSLSLAPGGSVLQAKNRCSPVPPCSVLCIACVCCPDQIVGFHVVGLVLMQCVALILLTTSGVLPWARCSRHSESGVYTLALYFVQVCHQLPVVHVVANALHVRDTI